MSTTTPPSPQAPSPRTSGLNPDIALNDQQNGWQNGPRVDTPNNDRERDSWRSDEKGYGDHYTGRQKTTDEKPSDNQP